MHFVLAGIGVVFQVYFIIHVIKNGKDRSWIYIIFFFSVVGCLVYFFVEYLPDLQSGHSVKETVKQRMKLSYLKDQVELVPSVKNKKALAEGYINKGMFDEAVRLYQGCLEGLHENDPSIIEGLCCAYFFKGDLETAKNHLLDLRNMRADSQKDEFDVLLARTYEEMGDTETALKEYEQLVDAVSGEEVRCRYALLLKKIGKKDEANRHFKDILKNARLSPKYYQKAQKKWISIARRHA